MSYILKLIIVLLRIEIFHGKKEGSCGDVRFKLHLLPLNRYQLNSFVLSFTIKESVNLNFL